MSTKSLARAPSKLPRIALSKAGGKKVTLEDAPKGVESSSGGSGPGGKSNKQVGNMNIKIIKVPSSKLKGNKSAWSSSASRDEIVVPAYLDPQPRYFRNTWKEDMVVETFDPMADSEEEEPVVEEAFTAEYDEDFDYEKLYMEDASKGGDDYDDYSRESGKPSVGQIPLGTAEETEAEGGDEEEEEEAIAEQIEEPDDENLEECDDRSDDEIAQERVMKELYEHAFADIMALTVTKEAEVEAPSITQKSLDEYFQDREEDKIAQ